MEMLLRGIGPYGITIINLCAVCHGRAVKGFWALWDNNYEFSCCCNLSHGKAVKGF
jgi:hypothetical protein